MRLFTLVYFDGEPSRHNPLTLAQLAVALQPEEVNELETLEVGQTFVDLDGDTWERIA